jgi:class 3 adenylate cyclase
MAVFIGDRKNTLAVRAALKINWAVKQIIQRALKNQYANSDYVLKHVVGIDCSSLLVARIGIRGANDLVWVGRAANYAAKLCVMDADFPTWITESVYNRILDEAKYSEGKNIWEARIWTKMNNMPIFRSTYYWELS